MNKVYTTVGNKVYASTDWIHCFLFNNEMGRKH